MKKIGIIAAVDQGMGIGYENHLLFHLKKDMRKFRERTAGNVVVLGRKTLESFPGGKPLPDRVHIVLSRQGEKIARELGKEGDSGFFTAASVGEAMDIIEKMERDVYIIGGEQIYRAFWHLATDLYITRIFGRRQADTFFPCINEDGEWEKISESREEEEDGISFVFQHYKRRLT